MLSPTHESHHRTFSLATLFRYWKIPYHSDILIHCRRKRKSWSALHNRNNGRAQQIATLGFERGDLYRFLYFSRYLEAFEAIRLHPNDANVNALIWVWDDTERRSEWSGWTCFHLILPYFLSKTPPPASLQSVLYILSLSALQCQICLTIKLNQPNHECGESTGGSHECKTASYRLSSSWKLIPTQETKPAPLSPHLFSTLI